MHDIGNLEEVPVGLFQKLIEELAVNAQGVEGQIISQLLDIQTFGSFYREVGAGSIVEIIVGKQEFLAFGGS